MNNKILQRRISETFNEVIDRLSTCHKCVMIRPTGFGKTYIMTRLVCSNKYNKVLYVYPTDIVRKQAELELSKLGALDRVEFITYTKLGRYSKQTNNVLTYINSKFDLVIFDEMHHMGAELVRKTLDEVIPKLDSVDILGGTATPKRMDNFDIIGRYFDNRVISFYTLDNAINDGIMLKPYYVYAVDGYKDILNDIKNRLNGTKQKLISAAVKLNMQNDIRRIGDLTNAAYIIKDTIYKVYRGGVPDYMRFMVFFSDKMELERKENQVIKWFEDAYQDYRINNLVIHSSIEERKNLEVLETLPCTPGRIDLIMCINMINEGYHVDDVTGVILLRPTKSSIVYTQQIGRCMKVNAKHPPIIFDFVGNIAVKSIFDMNKIVKSDNMSDAIDNQMNSLSLASVHMVDKVAQVKQVLNKINQDLPTDIELKVIESRISGIPFPADFLAKIHNINVWEVYKILDKYGHILVPLNLQRQEGDNYENGWTGGKLIENSKVDGGDLVGI